MYPDRDTISRLLSAPDVLLQLLKEKYNKALNVWSLGKLRTVFCFVFPQVLIFPRTKSRKTSRLEEKQNCFPGDHALSVRCSLVLRTMLVGLMVGWFFTN